MDTIFKKGRIKVEKEKDSDLFFITIKDELNLNEEYVGFTQIELTEFINTINEFLKIKTPKNFRERYAKIAKSEWFKKAYENKSVGEIIEIDK